MTATRVVMELLLSQNNDRNQSVTIPVKSIGSRFHYLGEFFFQLGMVQKTIHDRSYRLLKKVEGNSN